MKNLNRYYFHQNGMRFDMAQPGNQRGDWVKFSDIKDILNSIDNKHMLQRPQNCKECFFQHKCKNKECSIDNAIGGHDCVLIWANYRRKQQHA